MKQFTVNTFAPGKPHETQQQILDVLDSGKRFVMIRAGRKWRKTSLIISWLFEKAFQTGLVCTYIAPSRKQAKDIVWNDHVVRMVNELKKNKIPYKANETELSITLPNNGKVQLHGVENKDALRGISNWGAVAMDEYDDWEEDIWPTVILPNLIPHSAPCIIAGTPKGFKNLYKIENETDKNGFKCFHFKTSDNPDISQEELQTIENEYKNLGMGYFRQEILAEYEKPRGVVYEEWSMDNMKHFSYDPVLPLYMTFDFGVNDPTAILWVQKCEGEYRVIDYIEESNGDVGYFVQQIQAKPYKSPEMVCGDPAGKARSLTSNTSPIDEYAKKGIYIRTKDGTTLQDQIRITHKYIKSLFVSDTCKRVMHCLVNYHYPEKKTSLNNQSNEVPVHDEYSHIIRALEYLFVNLDEISPTTYVEDQWKKDAWRIGKPKGGRKV